MTVYKVLVVDDEAEIREGIIHAIDWEYLGFVVVGRADNGMEALDMVEQLEPDLVLSDIKMPYMDGLTLAEKIRAINLSTKVIIFSGFDDFDFARRAIELNVWEYIMKPVSAQELRESLGKLRDRLDRERGEKRDLERMRDLFNRSIPMLREQFIQELIDGTQEENRLWAEAEMLGFSLLPGKIYAVAYFGLCPFQTEEGQNVERTALRVLSLAQLLEEQINRDLSPIVLSRLMGAIVLLQMDRLEQLDVFIKEASALCPYIRALLGFNSNVGVSLPVDRLDRIASAYQEAQRAYNASVLDGPGALRSIRDVESTDALSGPDFQSAWKDIAEALMLQQREQATARVKQYLEGVQKGFYDENRLHEIGWSFQLQFAQIDRLLNGAEDKTDAQLNLHEILRIKNLSQLEEWCRQKIEASILAIDCGRRNSSARLAEEAKNYIRHNAFRPDLTIDQLCAVLHVSPPHFSMVFKKECDMTFVAYLTKMRLEKACELLETTGDKTYEIAQKVGYSEANYFSFVFKKAYGLSPTAYRRRFMKEMAQGGGRQTPDGWRKAES